MPTVIDHTVAAAAALRQLSLTHATHDVLCAVAKLEAAHGMATIPGVAILLRCSFQNVSQQVDAYGELFVIQSARQERRLPVRRLTLSPAGIALMAQIQAKTAQCQAAPQ